jgi:hypothetical protein
MSHRWRITAGIAGCSCALFLSAAVAAAGEPSADGHWSGAVISVPGRMEAEVVVDLWRGDGGWAGEIAVPSGGIERQPLVDVTVDGEKVAFAFERDGSRRAFAGRLVEGGRVLRGTYSRGEQRMSFDLDRSGPSRREARVPPPVDDLRDLSPTFDELRSAFNADRGKVRLLAVLSPSCQQCVVNAAIVQRTVLQKIGDERLHAYVVWLPILDDDSRAAAARAGAVLHDPRAVQMWAAEPGLRDVLRGPLAVQREVWDVVLVYGPEAVWEGETPPPPAYLSHMWEDLDLLRAEQFDGLRLADQVRSLLASAP